MPQIWGCLCKVALGTLLRAGARTSACSQQRSKVGGHWAQLSAFSPPPTQRSSLTGGIAPRVPEIPPASIETNPSDPEHHLGRLPGALRHALPGGHRPRELGHPRDPQGSAQHVMPPTPLCPSLPTGPLTARLQLLLVGLKARRLFCERPAHPEQTGSYKVHPPGRAQMLLGGLIQEGSTNSPCF